MSDVAFEAANLEAEHLLRPFLTSGAVFGITPDHRWNQSGTPYALRDVLLLVLMNEQRASALSEIRENDGIMSMRVIVGAEIPMTRRMLAAGLLAEADGCVVLTPAGISALIAQQVEG